MLPKSFYKLLPDVLPMTERNERKIEILEFVAREGEVTPDQVADALGMEIHHARMQLQRYWKMDLLQRRMINRKTKQRAYRITEKGLERIEWLKGEPSKKIVRELYESLRTLMRSS